MTNPSSATVNQQIETLSSQWGELSKYLLATFYEVKKVKDDVWARTPECDQQIVCAPLLEGNIDISLNWQSPFEQFGTDNIMPTLTRLLQTGESSELIEAGQEAAKATGITQVSNMLEGASQTASKFVGRSGLTKLNSMQAFTGMPPLKIQATVYFRAWQDAQTEVEAPFNKLVQWALPVEISNLNSVALRGIQQFSQNDNNWMDAVVNTMMPSQSPCLVGMQYKNRVWSPLVIEHISAPVTGPCDAGGHPTELSVQLTLCSLRAWDRKDWAQAGDVANFVF